MLIGQAKNLIFEMPPWSTLVTGLLWLLSSVNFEHISAIRTYDEHRLAQLRSEVKSMFYHAYDSYIRHAYPYDELRPLSCDGVDTWGSYSLTLIDTLDTLAVIGNYTEFRRVAQLIIDNAHFDMNINVSVFETNIRIIGGLLSAHMLSHKAGMEVEKGWPCNGPLLRLAEKVARKLLPAFDTNTGMPYGTVNLRYGVPPQETPVTCTAGVGTFIVEFGALSRLTGDPIYEKVALRAMHALYSRRSPLDLFGNHIDTQTGKWTAVDSGIGAGIDSYFEYLVKGAILFQKPELMHMFRVSFRGIEKHLGKNGWYVWATMGQGHVSSTTFQSLESYWPGLLSLVGEFRTGLKAIMNYHRIWKQYGALPELYNIVHGKASHQREGYPLRPELVESAMYLYRATRDPFMLEIGEDILRGIAYNARTDCGYATIRDVTTLTLEDRMESFFLAETLKYLYLLFDEDNFIHSQGDDFTVIDNPRGTCTLYAGGYIFNTEAHPIDPSALLCCTGVKEQELHEEIAIIDEFRLSQPFHGKDSLYTFTSSSSKGEEDRTNLLKLHKTDLDEVEIEDGDDDTDTDSDANHISDLDADQKSDAHKDIIPPSLPSSISVSEDLADFDLAFNKLHSETANLLNKIKLKQIRKTKTKIKRPLRHKTTTLSKSKSEKDVCIKRAPKTGGQNPFGSIANSESESEETCEASDQDNDLDDTDEEQVDTDTDTDTLEEEVKEKDSQSLLERLLKKLFEDQEESNQNQNEDPSKPQIHKPQGPSGLLQRLQQNLKLEDLDLDELNLNLGAELSSGGGNSESEINANGNSKGVSNSDSVQFILEESKKIEKMIQNFEKTSGGRVKSQIVNGVTSIVTVDNLDGTTTTTTTTTKTSGTGQEEKSTTSTTTKTKTAPKKTGTGTVTPTTLGNNNSKNVGKVPSTGEIKSDSEVNRILSRSGSTDGKEYEHGNNAGSSSSSSSPSDSEPDLDLIFGTKANDKSLSFYFSLKWLREFPELIRQLIPSESFDLQAFYTRLNSSYTDEQFSRDFNFSSSWLHNHRILKCPEIEMADRFLFFKSSVD